MQARNSLLLQLVQVFESYKKLGEKAMDQVNDEEIHYRPNEESNSIALIVKHLHGNMISRWTDFLHSDGEKPDRDRDGEFIDNIRDREHLLNLWEQGWNCLLHTLGSLREEDLENNVTIRGEQHNVTQAILRQIAHYSYHTGQIVYLAKSIRKESWGNLSIKKGESRQFNESMLRKNQ